MTATATVQPASWQDYWQLTKPRVVLVMQFTAVIGMLLIAVLHNLGGLLLASSVAVVLCARQPLSTANQVASP